MLGFTKSYTILDIIIPIFGNALCVQAAKARKFS
jgi:hypothetical protein